MYDFWHTLGIVVIQPAFLDNVAKLAAPNFRRITRTIVETDPTNKPKTEAFANEVSAGKLEAKSTRDFRVALHLELAALARQERLPAPVPTSVYTAGRLSQLLLIPEIGFAGPTGYIQAAQKALQQAIQDTTGADLKNFPNTFPAFVGLCMIDGGLRFLLQDSNAARERVARSTKRTAGGPLVDDLPELLEEFGISQDPASSERQVITKFIDGTNDALSKVMSDENNPWERVCPDWLVYWSPQSDRVVI